MTDRRKLKIKLKRSLIGCSQKQRAVVQALGLKRREHEVEHHESPTIMGMIAKVSHLIAVEVA